MYLTAGGEYKCLVVTCPRCVPGGDERLWMGRGAPLGRARHVVSRSCWEDRSPVSAGADASWRVSNCWTGLLTFRPQNCGSESRR